MAEVKLLTIGDLSPVLNHLVELLVNVLNEVLSCCFKEKDLVIMVSMVAQVAALFAN